MSDPSKQRPESRADQYAQHLAEHQQPFFTAHVCQWCRLDYALESSEERYQRVRDKWPGA